MAAVAPTGRGLSRADAEDFLFHEARLLDDVRLDEWLALFTEDALYWIPMDESKPASTSMSIVYDNPVRLEERVYHLLHVPFAAQAPRSRTVHLVTNVVVDGVDRGETVVSSNLVVYEVRLGDFRQVGLGEVRPIVARVEHRLRDVDGALRIARKKVLLIDREMPQSNLTFVI